MNAKQRLKRAEAKELRQRLGRAWRDLAAVERQHAQTIAYAVRLEGEREALRQELEAASVECRIQTDNAARLQDLAREVAARVNRVLHLRKPLGLRSSVEFLIDVLIQRLEELKDTRELIQLEAGARDRAEAALERARVGRLRALVWARGLRRERDQAIMDAREEDALRRRAEDERDEARNDVERIENEHQNCGLDFEVLKRNNAALSADARRYRYLIDYHAGGCGEYKGSEPSPGERYFDGPYWQGGDHEWPGWDGWIDRLIARNAEHCDQCDGTGAEDMDGDRPIKCTACDGTGHVAYQPHASLNTKADSDACQKWATGRASCAVCGHAWVAVATACAPALECPRCGEMAGALEESGADNQQGMEA